MVAIHTCIKMDDGVETGKVRIIGDAQSRKSQAESKCDTSPRLPHIQYSAFKPESTRAQIQKTRDELHDRGVTIFSSHVFGPLIVHGSQLTFAPDEVFLHLAYRTWGLAKAAHQATARFYSEAEWNPRRGCKKLWEFAKGSPGKCIMFACLPFSFYAFHCHGEDLTCLMKNTFTGWADWNREVNPAVRFASISAMMTLRLVMGNLLPFTSPAFAYLIAKSQPVGEEWAGTLYLLICSMPAGAVIPALDKLAEFAFGTAFLVTHYASIVTDYLPFSFWVRPYVMQPAFNAAKRAGSDSPTAAATAVLAGHFMIWAGPATTMHQRLFVPDWQTCVLVQPLGLMEDVAVVLATWAGATAQSQKSAQIALYAFMLSMTVAHFVSTDLRNVPRHALVAFMIVAVAVQKSLQPVAEIITPPENSNTQAILVTVVTVSAQAILFSIVAKGLGLLAGTCRHRSALTDPLLA